MTEGAEMGFTAAMAELDQILARLEDDQVDVDNLAADVRRAGELIGFCRNRIDGTRLEIEQIIADLDGAEKPEIAPP